MKRFKFSELEKPILQSQKCVREIYKKGHPPQLELQGKKKILE